MLASPALAGAHSFAASVYGNLLVPSPPVPAPARRAALSVVAKVKVATPQDDRIARHVRLRKKVGICARTNQVFRIFLLLLLSSYECGRQSVCTNSGEDIFSLCIRLC